MVAELLVIVSGYSLEIHGSTLWRQLKLYRLVNLENEPVQARQRQASAEQALNSV